MNVLDGSGRITADTEVLVGQPSSLAPGIAGLFPHELAEEICTTLSSAYYHQVRNSISGESCSCRAIAWTLGVGGADSGSKLVRAQDRCRRSSLAGLSRRLESCTAWQALLHRRTPAINMQSASYCPSPLGAGCVVSPRLHAKYFSHNSSFSRLG